MVKNRHGRSTGIPEVGFRAPVGTPAGVEVMSLAGLRSRVGARVLQVPRRPTFHHVLTVTGGALRHTVDFTDHTLRPGMWLWVRPGQVQQWGDITDAEGTLVVFEQDFLDPATGAAARLHDPHATIVGRPAAGDHGALAAAADHLAHAFGARGQLPAPVHRTVLRHLLAVLVLQLAHLFGPAGGPAAEPDETFRRFRDAVERDFVRSRRVEDYAHALGYSPRTLSRATVAAAGVNAKEYIDRRVILEARRLLAHSGQTGAQIAARLGFTSATNFTKYFRHRTGTTPGAFRARLLSEPGA